MTDEILEDPVVQGALRAIGEKVVRSGQLCPHCGRRTVNVNNESGLCYRCEQEQEDRIREGKRRWYQRNKDSNRQEPTGTDRSRRDASDPDTGDMQLVTVTEAANRLAVSRRTIERLIASGDLRSTVIGRARRIPEDAITDLILAGDGEQDTA